MDIQKTLVAEFDLKPAQVENTIKLIDEGNTIPFIARYRKELTGSLDDQTLRTLYDRLLYLRGLDEKREQVKNLIAEQGKMTEEIAASLTAATTLTEIEDIYRPFRPKRRTRATIAKERGLEPLSELIWAQKIKTPLENAAADFLNPETEITTPQDALAGASDILAELISDDAHFRAVVRRITWDGGILISTAVDEKKDSVYEMYYQFQEPVQKIAGHRVLAINRGEDEDFLRVRLEAPVDEIHNRLFNSIVKENPFTKDFLAHVIEDAYKRLIAPSIERDIRNEITGKAQDGAIRVFGENLKQLLLQPPIKDKVVLALDPGFRTGCKVAVIDGTGKVLDTGVAYCSIPKMTQKIEESKRFLKPLIQKHGVEVVAIGNGTASRETESFVVDLIKELDRDVLYVIVNEAGASVYSASKLGAEEFPQYDVALRSAVSIGRRLLDPLAELVKIDPKSIGVGQYQHDMNQKMLNDRLSGVVENCVNMVGVNLNTASPSLLSYVAGVSFAVAKNILEYREVNGKFKSRKELMKVKKLGPKAYEQCAGFLRIPEAEYPLDNTGVHPESYAAAEKFLAKLGFSPADVKAGKAKNLKKQIDRIDALAAELGVGAPTLSDIITELEKPGRDLRDELPPVVLRGDVLSMEDLQEGMVLTGTVRNVIDFGVFVDIGVHQDGLVHISQIADKYIKHPLDAVSVGDVVNVKVLSVDVGKKRIGLSIKGAKTAPAAPA